MRKKLYSLILSSALLFSSAIPVQAQNYEWIEPKFLTDSVQSDISSRYSPDDIVTFIVEVEGDPVFAQGSANNSLSPISLESEQTQAYTQRLLQTQSEVMSDINNNIDADIKKGYTYTFLFNGFSITGKYSDMELLKEIPGVESVYISQEYEIIKPELTESGECTGADYAYNSLGYLGEGQVIAIVDSEFDISHEFFDTSLTSPKLVKSDIKDIMAANDLNAEAWFLDAEEETVSYQQVFKNSKIPFAFDYGCSDTDTFSTINVHGTHVAGIAAGKQSSTSDGKAFSGFAPQAQLVLMKVADSNGRMYQHYIVAALEDAIALGVSAINLSLGTDYATIYDPSSFDFGKVITNARASGILVSVSAGNSSRGYLEKTPTTKNIDYAASGTPNDYPASTSVAAADNGSVYSFAHFTLADGLFVPAAAANNTSTFFTDFAGKSYEYVFCGLGEKDNFSNLDLTGKLALIKRGTITFAEKAENALNAGAEGIILWNNADTNDLGTVDLVLPAAAVSKADGELLYNAADKTLSVSEMQSVVSTGGIADFSSWGTTDNLDLNPQIAFPGRQIYSSVPEDGYESWNGTSMAAPALTGTVAIMNQHYQTNPYNDEMNNLTGDAKVTFFENLLMSTADVIKEDNVPLSPRLQGAGFANIEDTLTTKVILKGSSSKTKINLSDNLGSDFTLDFTVKNLGSEDITFNASADVTTDGYYEDGGEYLVKGSTLLLSQSYSDPITVGANSEITVSLPVSLDEDTLKENMEIYTNGFYIDGFVYLTSDTHTDLNIPFTGFYGDWADAPIFDTTMYDEGGSSLYREGDSTSPGTVFLTEYGSSYTYAGRNLLDGTFDKNHIAFSPDISQSSNGDGYADSPYLYIQALRANSPLLAIYTESGELKQAINFSSDVLLKYYAYSFKIGTALPEFFNLAEGNYFLRVSGAYPWQSDSVSDDSLELPFVIDKTAPEILYAIPDASAGTLTIAARDNHYIQNIIISDGSSVEYVTFNNTKQNSTDYDYVTAVFELPDTDLSNVQIQVNDFALNQSMDTARNVLYDLKLNIDDVSASDSGAQVYYTVKNLHPTDITADIMLAFYDKDGVLTDVYMSEDYTCTRGATIDSSAVSIKDKTKLYKVKIFAWSSIDTMAPAALSDEYYFED